ncbi:MAG: dihydroorotase family protein [Candidatus Peribacteraceae bacterium]
MKPLLIRDATLVHPMTTEKVDVLVENGTIARLESHDSTMFSSPSAPDDPAGVIEAAGWLLLPGLIDCHVHLREPGLTHKGDMETETRAALHGGVTTVCDMPNAVPPTVTIGALKEKIKLAKRIKDCDIRFFFGVAEMAHIEDLGKVWEDEDLRKHLVGAKLFLDHSTGDLKASPETVAEAFRVCGDLGIPLTAHCENPGLNAAADKANKRTDIAAHSIVRPPESEEVAVRGAIELAKKYGTKLHIAHISTVQGVECVREAKAAGLPVTCEVAPHHLFLTTDDYATLGTLAKMNPPLRTAEHRDALWAGIEDGTIDCIATDHAPHTLEEKETSEALKAPSGVPGVEVMLPLLLTVAARGWPHPATKRPPIHLDKEDIVRLCFENPNQIFGLKKHPVSEGRKADCILVDSDEEWTIRGKELHSKCKWTPYEGWLVRGKVVRVIR